MIAHNRLRGDHRPRRRISQPLIDAGQTAVRKNRPRHPQCISPPRPHRFGGQRPRQQQRRIHPFGGGPQHSRGNRPGGVVDHRGQLHPVNQTVIKHDSHIQRRGIDLDYFTRAGHRDRPERAIGLLGQRAAGPRRPKRVPAFSQAFDQPIKRRLRRHRRSIVAAIDGHQRLSHLALQPLHRACRQISLAVDRITHRRDHPLIDTAEHRLTPVMAPIDDAQQAVTFVGEPAPLQRITAHLMPGSL
ncbi:Uncharacterised protein [Mycobacteroides abscessus subsp. abscessus]|nr:Uncharacterised protein [Mycobacteroides abscessus subsp. abscessus]SIN14312.1 Uncharacterised protein [Mycobacteroides abscessus subsp. abscessus]